VSSWSSQQSLWKTVAEKGGSLGLPFLRETHNVIEEDGGSQDARPNITDQRNLHDHKQTTMVTDVRGSLAHSTVNCKGKVKVALIVVM